MIGQSPAVQKQLNAVLSSALAVVTPMAKPGAVEVNISGSIGLR